MSLINRLRESQAQTPKVEVPQINVALPQPQTPEDALERELNAGSPYGEGGLQAQMEIGSQPPIPTQPVIPQGNPRKPQPPAVPETQADVFTGNIPKELNTQEMIQNLQVSDVAQPSYPVLFQPKPFVPFPFTQIPKYEPAPTIPITPGLSAPYDPNQPFDDTRKPGQGANNRWGSALNTGLDWLTRAGNAVEGLVFDTLNIPNLAREAMNRTEKAARDLGLPEPVVGLIRRSTGLGAVARIPQIISPITSRVGAYFDKKKEDEDLTWEDFVPTIRLDGTRIYTIEALQGRSTVSATEDVRNVGLPGKSPIGLYQPRFDNKDRWSIDPRSNPTWWAGLGTDFIVSAITGLTFEHALIHGAGTAAVRATGSQLAGRAAARATDIVLNPVGELAFKPILKGVNRGLIRPLANTYAALAEGAVRVFQGEIVEEGTNVATRVFINTGAREAVGLLPPAITFAKPKPVVDVTAIVPRRSMVALTSGQVGEVIGGAGENVIVKNAQGTVTIPPWDIKRIVSLPEAPRIPDIKPSARSVIEDAIREAVPKTQTPEIPVVAPKVQGAATIPLLPPARTPVKLDLLDGTKRPVSSPSHVPLEIRKVIADFVNGEKPVLTPAREIKYLPPSLKPTEIPGVVETVPNMPVDIPAVNPRVFQGTMSMQEFSKVISEQVPGTQIDVDSLAQSPRTLKQLHALARHIYKNDKPIISERIPRTYAEFYAKLDRLQLLPSERRVLERYGYPIPEEVLNAPDFRIVIAEANPIKNTPEISVLQRNIEKATPIEPKLGQSVAELSVLEGATDIKVEGSLRTYKVAPTYVEAATGNKYKPTAEQVARNIQREIEKLELQATVAEDMGQTKKAARLRALIEEKQSQLIRPNVIEDPLQLAAVQKEVLPPELHGNSPETVLLTQKKIDTEVELKDLGDTIDNLKRQYQEVSNNLEASASRTIETQDLGRKFTPREIPVKEPKPPSLREVMRYPEWDKPAAKTEDYTIPIYQGSRVKMEAFRRNGVLELGWSVDDSDTAFVSRKVPTRELSDMTRAFKEFADSRAAKEGLYSFVQDERGAEDFMKRALHYQRMGMRLESIENLDNVPTLRFKYMPDAEPLDADSLRSFYDDLDRAILEDNMGEIPKLRDEIQQMFKEAQQDVTAKAPDVPVQKTPTTTAPTPKAERSVENVPMVRSSMESEVAAPAEGLWYHGTRVKGLNTDIDPVLGGSRAEWGTGMYLTRNSDLASSYAKAEVSPNLPPSITREFTPNSGEVITYTLKPNHKSLYAHRPFNDDLAEILFPVAHENLGATEARRFANLVGKKKTLSEALDYLDDAAARGGLSEEHMLKMNREVSLALRNSGIDVIYDNNTLNVLNPRVLVESNRATQIINVDEPLFARAHRFNADSVTAANNPQSRVAQINFEESAVKLQAEMKAKIAKDLAVLEEQRSYKIQELLDTERNLEEVSAKDRTVRARQMTESSRTSQTRQLRKINETFDPCDL